MEHWKNKSLIPIKGERWMPILGFNKSYEVSNYGRIKSLSRAIPCMNGYRKTNDKILSLRKDRFGYLFITLSVNSKSIRKAAHRLELESFKPIKNKSLQCNHKNGIKQDNWIGNLEWVTASENQIHSFLVLGKMATKPWLGKKGYKNYSSKEVICLTNNKKYGSAHEAAEKLGVDYRNVSAVCLGNRKSTGGLIFNYV